MFCLSPADPSMAYSLIYLVLCLNVLSEDVSLMILYKIVPSFFSKPLLCFIFVGFYLSLPESTVFYAYIYSNTIYLSVGCLTPTVECQLQEGRECSMHIKQCLA